jgi:hypothetical protein
VGARLDDTSDLWKGELGSGEGNVWADGAERKTVDALAFRNSQLRRMNALPRQNHMNELIGMLRLRVASLRSLTLRSA